jgi:hypothetical protein
VYAEVLFYNGCLNLGLNPDFISLFEEEHNESQSGKNRK